jgi:hypothetical protein
MPQFNKVTRLFLISIALLLGMNSCSVTPQGNQKATATAQADRAARLATRMATHLEETRQVDSLQATATVQAMRSVLTEVQNWPLVLSDDFDPEKENWPSGESDGDMASAEWLYQPGKMQWSAKAKENFIWWATPKVDPIADFYLNATLQQTSGPENGQVGVIFRQANEESYYMFGINNQQEYAIFLHWPTGWEIIQDWSTTPVIHSDQPNELAVIGQGPKFIFFINQQIVTSLSDKRLSSGKVGIVVGLYYPGDQALWEFSHFELRKSPGDLLTN